MFHKIMVPVDLAHLDRQEAALKHAGDLAKLYGAEVIYVGVTTGAPSATAHTPEEFAEKMMKFAAAQGELGGFKTHADTELSHDPRADLDDTLVKAAEKTGAELVVMQSHMPNISDFFWPSNGSKVAEHAKCSVTLVRA